MKTMLILVGKTTDKHLTALMDDYVSRLGHYNIGFSVSVIPEVKNTKSLSENQQKQMEGQAILKALQESDHVVLLDENGATFSSMEMARWMERKIQSGVRRLVFVIGGPYGFSEEVYRRANEKLSLSRMTFSHQMVRLIFTEQLYRSMTIIKGEQYHHQ